LKESFEESRSQESGVQEFMRKKKILSLSPVPCPLFPEDID
jgi:hypothetical protein